MVALYTIVYLSLTSSELLQTQEKTATLSSLFDYFFIFHHFQLHKVRMYFYLITIPNNTQTNLSYAIGYRLSAIGYRL
jgi:hypothetical protein